MEFIKSIAPHLESLGITTPGYDHIVSDIVTEVITNSEEGARKYYKGNFNSYYSATKKIKASIIDELIRKDVYHNEAQRVMMDVRIKAAIVHKLLYLGYRKAAINIAHHVYNKAVRYHIYDIGSNMGTAISQHYGQHEGDLSKCKLWFRKQQECAAQQSIVNKAVHLCDILSCKVRHQKTQDEDLMMLFEKAIGEMALYKDEANSYLYWYNYYYFKSCLHEGRGEYDEMVLCSLEGFEYFTTLPIDHQSAKLAMVSQIIHAYSLNYNYSAAMEYHQILNELSSAGTNKDMTRLRLSKAYINLGMKAEALDLIDAIQSDHSDVVEKKELYRSYVTHEYAQPIHTKDPEAMGVAEKIALLYCDIHQGKTERHTHDYLMQYIRRRQLQDSREGIVIKMLSLLRYKGYDERKFKAYHGLRERLEHTDSTLTEVEILRYETLVDEVFGIV